jgi:chaperonin GroEL
LAYRRLKVEDSINSAYSAMHSGILAGGGVALDRVKSSLPTTVGGDILRTALYAPIQQIASNAGIKLERGFHGNEGYNSKTGEVVDMFDAGIVDSYDVVLGAVKSAIGVAAGVLTAGSVVLLPRNENSIDEAIKNAMQTPQ